jgi:hypothetical protein
LERAYKDFYSKRGTPKTKDNAKMSFLIVEVKEWTDAEVKTSSDRSKGLKMGGKIPVRKAAQLPTDKLDLAGEVDWLTLGRNQT